MLKVVEKFISINGEGRRAGQLALFIRFAGCNLDCSYCDTSWANKSDVHFEPMSADDIYSYIKSAGVQNVTLTGGEPLMHEGIAELLQLLSKDKSLYVEIETNGSISLEKFCGIDNPPSFTMDYKLPSSNMEDKMDTVNFDVLTSHDTVKFVCGSQEDLQKTYDIIEKYGLSQKTAVYISPVFGNIEPEDIVEFMKKHNMNGVNLQLQLHKIIWSPDKKGV